MKCIGQKYGRLTIIRRLKPEERKSKYKRWLCKCDCGNEIQVDISHLRNGNTKSCGCLQREHIASINYKHGKWKTPLFNVWIGMRNRCYRKHTKDYANYGGRGITICSEWKDDFETFEKWAFENGYQEGLTIDRQNVDGNYEPSNCRWTTIKQQNNNKRDNRYITYHGKTQSMQMWADETGISSSAIKYRLNHGWSVEDALSVPILHKGQRFHGRGKNINKED